MKEKFAININKKDLQKILKFAKKEIKEWSDFIKLVEEKIKNENKK